MHLGWSLCKNYTAYKHSDIYSMHLTSNDLPNVYAAEGKKMYQAFQQTTETS